MTRLIKSYTMMSHNLQHGSKLLHWLRQALTYDIQSLLKKPQGFLAGNSTDAVAENFAKRLENAHVDMSFLKDQNSKKALDEYFLGKGNMQAFSPVSPLSSGCKCDELIVYD